LRAFSQGSDRLTAMSVPAEASPLQVDELVKRYGPVTAVDGLSFAVQPGAVTGFLGPNGAGKTTTMRLLLGLAAPTQGTARVIGAPYSKLQDPLKEVGAVLEITGFHPGRSGRNHLRIMAGAGHLPIERIDVVLEQVGMSEAAERRVGTYSLGMRQRLGLAGAMLGDPQILILDEPANGLDPAGVAWLRAFLRAFADAGRTVFVSSHVLAEMAQIADRIVVIDKGKLVADGPVDRIVSSGAATVLVRSPDLAALGQAIEGAGGATERTGHDGLLVSGLTPAQVGEIAAARAIVLHELRQQERSLEEAFLKLTSGDGL
jgi:ABC-2 type transport system ATP-binding protein